MNFQSISSTLLGFFLAALCLLPSCQPPCTPMEPMSCPPPESIGVNSFFVEAINVQDGIQFVWNSVPGADSYDFQVGVNFAQASVFNQTGLTDTTFTIILDFLAIDDDVVAGVRSRCSDECWDYLSEFETITLKNRNGGATVDPVPSFMRLDQFCAEDPCSNEEYIHFPDGLLQLCDGTFKKLGLKYSREVYFLRDDVCACLNTYPNPCEALINIEECLTQRYLKRDYSPCP